MEEEERREKKERKVGRKSEWEKGQSGLHYLAFIIAYGGALGEREVGVSFIIGGIKTLIKKPKYVE